MKTYSTHFTRLRALVFASVTILSLIIGTIAPASISAAQITARKVTLSTSSAAAAAATTTYTFNFTVPSSTVIKSYEALACTTASGACTTPTGFSVASSTISQPTNLGDASGWTVSTATAGSLRLSKSGNVAAPTGAQTVVFNNVQNPTTTNTAFFLRMSTFSDASWATPIDTGTVAASTANQINVTASVDETLTFCVYTGVNCAASGSTVALGTLSSASTASGTSKMDAATNAGTGYAITYSGATLTSGANTITALGGAASSIGSSQYGINLKANTTPSVGSNVSGSGSGTAQGAYNTTDSFKFLTGETVASAGSSTATNTYTVSYIANISTVTPPGAYTSTLTYVCTATF